MDRRERIRWLGLEFMVIVLGVLSALFVDTWIDDRQDAERAEVYRQRLIADLESDIANLDAVRAYYESINGYGLLVLADLENKADLDDFALAFAAFNAAEEWGFKLEDATYLVIVMPRLARSCGFYLMSSERRRAGSSPTTCRGRSMRIAAK
jgi:hypothetical protein